MVRSKFWLKSCRPTAKSFLFHYLPLSVAIFLGAILPFSFVSNLEAQHQSMQNGALVLTIQPQIQLQQAGSNVVLKIRLARGATAKLWTASSCEAPTSDASTYTSSGTYTVPVQTLTSQNQGFACAASSDGLLNASVALSN